MAASSSTVCAIAVASQQLSPPSLAGLADVTQVEQRTIPFGVRLMCVNPTNHIIAIITVKNDLIVYNSTSWSQIFRKYTSSDGFEATCMTWRFDSRLLAIGYLNGKICLADVEDGKEVYKLFAGESEKESSSAVALLSWLPSSGWSKQGGLCEPRNHLNPYVLRLHELHDSAIPLPKQVSFGGSGNAAILADKAKLEYLNTEAKLFNQTRLSFLAAWYNPSRIVVYAYGLYAVMCIDFHSSSLRWTLRSADCINGEARVRMPLAIAMSADHRDLMLSYVVGINDARVNVATDNLQSDAVVQNTSIDTSILYFGYYELEAITFRLCKIDAYFEFIEKTLVQLDESCAFVSDDGLEFKLRDFLRNRQAKLTEYQADYNKTLAANTLDILLTDLVELLTVGMMDEELEQLVRTALTPDAVRRLSANLDRAYVKLRDLCIVHLHPALEAVVLLFDELRVFNCTPQTFDAFLGAGTRSKNICASLFETSASLLLKAKEFVCVIDQCVTNTRAFFEWVFIDLELLIAMPDGEVGHAWGFRGGLRCQQSRTNSIASTSTAANTTVGASNGAARNLSTTHRVIAQENDGRAVTGGGGGLGFSGAYAPSGSNSNIGGAAGNNDAIGSQAFSSAEEVRLHRLASNTNLSLGVGMGGVNDTITCVLEFIRDTFSQEVLLGSSDSADSFVHGSSSSHQSGQTLRLERVSQYLRDSPLDKCYPFCTATVAADYARAPDKYDLYTPGVWSTAGRSLKDAELVEDDEDNSVDDINEFSRRFVNFADDTDNIIADRIVENLEQSRESLRRRHSPLNHSLYRVERTKSLKQLFVELRRHTKNVLLPTITRNISSRIAINGTFPLVKLSEADGCDGALTSPNGTVVFPAEGGIPSASFVPQLQLSGYERFLAHANVEDASHHKPCNKFLTAIKVSPAYAEKLLGTQKVIKNNAAVPDGVDNVGMLLIIRHDIFHSKSSTLNVLRDAHFLENNDDFHYLDGFGRQPEQKQHDDAGLKMCSLLPAPSTNKVQHRVVLLNVTVPPPPILSPPAEQQVGSVIARNPLGRRVSKLQNFTYMHLTDQLMLVVHTTTDGAGKNNTNNVDAAHFYYVSLPQILADNQRSAFKLKISNERYPSATLFDFITNKSESATPLRLPRSDVAEGGEYIDAGQIIQVPDAVDDPVQPRRLEFAENMDVANVSSKNECFFTIKLAFVPAKSDRASTSSAITKMQLNSVPGTHWSVVQVVCMQKLAILFQPRNSAGANSGAIEQTNRVALVCLQPSIRARRAAEMSLHNNSSATSTNSVAGEADLFCYERETDSGVGNVMKALNTPLPVCNSHEEMLSATTASLFADLCLPQRFEFDASLACRARRFADSVAHATIAANKLKKRRASHEQAQQETLNSAEADDDRLHSNLDDDESVTNSDSDDAEDDEQMIASIFAELDANFTAGVGRVKQPDDPRWLSADYAAAVQPALEFADSDSDKEESDVEDDDWLSFMRQEAEATIASTNRQQLSKIGSEFHRRKRRDVNTPFAELASSSAFINSTLHKLSSSMLSANTTSFLRNLQSRVDELESFVITGENRRHAGDVPKQ